MRSERGQASVEWIGVVLLVTLALVGLTRLTPRADERDMGTTLLTSLVPTAPDQAPPPDKGFTAPPLMPRPGDMRPLPSVARMRRGVGVAWRRAWFACLAYERFRYGFLHPESRFPGHTSPPAELLRIGNDCISPVDLVRDWPLLRGR